MSDYLIIIRDLDGKNLLQIPASVFAAMAFTDDQLPTTTIGNIKVSVKRIEADKPVDEAPYTFDEWQELQTLKARIKTLESLMASHVNRHEKDVKEAAPWLRRIEILENRVANGEPPWSDAGPPYFPRP